MSAPGTRLALTSADKTFLYVAGSLAGAALGFAVPYLARWVADWPWVPFQGLLRLAGSADASWLVPARPVLGLLLGIGLAAWLIHESPVLHVSSGEVTVSRGGTLRRIPRSEVAGIFRDGSKVVLESSGGRRLFEGEVEGGKDVVRAAFVSHGYPWEAE